MATRLDLSEYVAQYTGLSIDDARYVIDTVCAGIKQLLVRDNKCSIVGFGTFQRTVYDEPRKMFDIKTQSFAYREIRPRISFSASTKCVDDIKLGMTKLDIEEAIDAEEAEEEAKKAKKKS